MNKKKIIIVCCSLILLFIAVLIYSNIGLNDKKTETVASNNKLINVDKIVENPEKYTGIVNIEGNVTEVNENTKYFTLGCEDACISLPVEYKGELPQVESNIIALGEVKKDVNGKYFFEAKEIKYK